MFIAHSCCLLILSALSLSLSISIFSVFSTIFDASARVCVVRVVSLFFYIHILYGSKNNPVCITKILKLPLCPGCPFVVCYPLVAASTSFFFLSYRSLSIVSRRISPSVPPFIFCVLCPYSLTANTFTHHTLTHTHTQSSFIPQLIARSFFYTANIRITASKFFKRNYYLSSTTRIYI